MASIPSPDDLAVVRRINVFRGLNPRMIQQMIAPATTLSLREGEVVCRQADPATAFFIVVEGWIKLYRITVAGDEAIINVLAKGDSFAESAAFTGSSYLHTAEAVSDARVIRVPVAHVVKCIQGAPEFAQAMIADAYEPAGPAGGAAEGEARRAAPGRIPGGALSERPKQRSRHLSRDSRDLHHRAALRQDADRGPARPQA